MYKFLQRHFLTGLLAITPLAITSWILWRFYVLVSATMRPWLQRIPAITETYPEFLLTFFGVVVFVLLITIVGLFTRNLIGIAFFRVLERFFEQIPVVKSVFSAIKQIAEVFLRDRRTAFQKVVLFAYPRQGLYSIGFVTQDEPGNSLVNVFLPTAPNPTSGFMLLVPRRELVELGIPVEDAIKLIVSGGSIMTAEQAHFIEHNVQQLAAAEQVDLPGKDLEK
ncbi:MAG: DUF502 domain-containing protein [Candidatus Krumholzibacteria bacterium]|nr:DUF502 domain-containing protein [Candidatus Krumholzibacteria bacterium]